MEEVSKRALFMSFRYILLLLVAIPNLWIFYSIFYPLTFYSSFALLKLFFGAKILGSYIVTSSLAIEIIQACVAGSAYYLLLILNLSVPNISIPKRLKMILFAFLSFLVLNTLRIFILSSLFFNSSSFFDSLHLIFWYFISIIMVILIWFAEVKLFEVREIPVYSDLKWLIAKIRNK